GGIGLDGELARQQEVAAIAFRDLHHIAARAQLGYVLFQDDFHGMTPFLISVARAPSPASSRLTASVGGFSAQRRRVASPPLQFLPECRNRRASPAPLGAQRIKRTALVRPSCERQQCN